MGSEPKLLRAFIKDPQHFKRVAESLQIFNLRQDYMDLCFVCSRGHRVFAHKLLLSAVSTDLKNMFLELPANMEMITIHLPDIEGRILRLLLDFLYEGSLKLIATDYTEFKNLQDLLGIVLQRSYSSDKGNPLQSGVSSHAQQPVQPQAVYYMQASGPNNQGQVQYILAASTTHSQGQMMQMSQATTPGQLMQVTQSAAGQMMQVTQNTATGQTMQVPQAAAPVQIMQVTQAPAPGQVMQVAASNTSMPQGQIMQMPPAIMSQANGQMMQGGGSTTIQRSNMMHVLPPQNNAQVVPMVAGNQMVQCSSQMVVQASQQTMLNNNQMQNQAAQSPQTQRPQYVMASTTNQMTTSRERVQYTQPQTTPQDRIAARSRTSTQVAQPTRNNAINNVRTRRLMRAPVPMAQNRSTTASRTIQRSRHSAQ